MIPPRAHNPFLSQISQSAHRSPQISNSLSVEEFSRQSAEICSKIHGGAQFRQPSLLGTPETQPRDAPAESTAQQRQPNGAFFELISLQHSLQQRQKAAEGRTDGQALDAAVREAQALQQAIAAETLDSQLLHLSERIGIIERLMDGARERRGREVDQSGLMQQQKLTIIALQEQNDILARTNELMQVEKQEMQRAMRRLVEQNDQLVDIIQSWEQHPPLQQ